MTRHKLYTCFNAHIHINTLVHWFADQARVPRAVCRVHQRGERVDLSDAPLVDVIVSGHTGRWS